MVPPVGPKTAAIAIVGEAPGAQEEEKGMPFVGGSGQLLTKVLEKVGLNRSNLWITNVSKERPPNNDFSIFYEGKKPSEKLLRMHEELFDELTQLPNLRLIICLGGEALRAVMGKVGIEAHRGTLETVYLAHRPVKALATYHPARILRVYSELPILYHDIEKAVRLEEPPSVNINCNASVEAVRDFLSKTTEFAFDIETGEGHNITCLGLGCDRRAVVIRFPISPTMWELLQEGFRTHQLIAHNAAFDITFLREKTGFTIDSLKMDTMVAFHTLASHLPKGLDFLCTWYTSYQNYWSGKQDLYYYNGMDAIVTHEVSLRIWEDLRSAKLLDFYVEDVNKRILPFLAMSRRGILVDTAKLAALQQEYDDLMNSIRSKYSFNLASPAQVKEALRARGLKIRSTQAEELEKFSNDEVVKDILAFKKALKLRAYGDMKLRDGRMLTSYNVAGTLTGRASSSKTPDGYGGNIQNIPKERFREIFIAPEGFKLIKADLSQAEARVVAWVAPVPELKELFLKPDFDIHRMNASVIFGVKEEAVTPEQRKLAKCCLHATNYGGGPQVAVEHAGVPYEIAEMARQRYLTRFPEIPRWWSRVEHEVKTRKYLRNPYGRIAYFFDRPSGELIRSAIAYVPQSTVADLVHRAARKLMEELPPPNYVVALVHDEIVVEAKDVDLAVGLIRKHLSEPVPGLGLVIPCEISIGDTWEK